MLLIFKGKSSTFYLPSVVLHVNPPVLFLCGFTVSIKFSLLLVCNCSDIRTLDYVHISVVYSSESSKLWRRKIIVV